MILIYTKTAFDAGSSHEIESTTVCGLASSAANLLFLSNLKIKVVFNMLAQSKICLVILISV